MYAFVEGFKILGLSGLTFASVALIGVVTNAIEKAPIFQFLFG